MRGPTQGLTLRKAKVLNKITPGHYLVDDLLNGNEIRMNLTGNQRMAELELAEHETVYVIVSELNLTRGRLAIPGHRGGLEGFKTEQQLLDAGRDPLLEK